MSDPLFPDNWSRLAPLVDVVLDAPADRREAILDEVSGGNLELRGELSRLVAECERDVPLMNQPAVERFAGLFDETDIEMPEVLGGRYRIRKEAGRGGMARVFLALDTKHDREVAVKVIRPDVAISLGSTRFLREIGIAARLRHPNIVPVYDSGETDGVLYYVMPFEEGPSLRAHLDAGGPMSVGTRINILRDVARALAYAHERGLVHRDIKPDNVLLSGGAAVVTDFGIAKALSAAQSDTQTGSLTQPGAGIGTPVYMAPEQAVGDPATDHRADIYSFGCLAYELFAGKPPFDNRSTHEIISAHVGQKPAPVGDLSSDVPLPVADLIMQCLEKLPANRPQSAQSLLNALERGDTGPAERAPTRRNFPKSVVFGVLAAAAIAIIGAAYLANRNRSADVTAPREITVAVLALVSSGDSIERELAYGLSDEIATALVGTPGVRVMSRRAVSASPEERDVDPAKTGKALGADYLVMGSLRQTAGRLTVLAKLVQARDGAMLWANQFNRNADDLGAVREEIARAVGDSLSQRSGTAGAARVKKDRPERAAEPYRLYMLAQRALSLRGLSIQASTDMFRRATELDSSYAEAFGGLSLSLALSPYFKPVAPKEVRADAIAAARRALQLDSTLAQPHVALGIVYSHAYKWDSATTELRTAVRLRDPGDVEPLVQYGRLLLFRGQTEAGLRQFLLARSTEPASALVRSWVAYAYYLAGQMDSALVENERAFQSDSTNMTTLTMGSVILLKSGQNARVLDYVRRMPRYQPVSLYSLSRAGDTVAAMARLRELELRKAPPWLYQSVRAFIMLGVRDTAQALTAFERATDVDDFWPTYQSIQDPIFDEVRSSERFQALLRRVRLR